MIDKNKIRKIIDHKIFFLTIQTLIIISLITFSLDTLPDLSSTQKKFLYFAEVITIVIFTLEYILRVFAAEKKIKFIFSIFGLIDLVSILPFYLPFLGVDLRFIRMFRLLRILKLLKRNKAIERFKRAWDMIKEELMMFGFLALIMIYVSAAGIYLCEKDAQPEQFKSVFHSLWWAVTTLTTVGYGDMFPITTGGKYFTFFILVIGLGIIAVPTGLISSALSQARSDEAKKNNFDTKKP